MQGSAGASLCQFAWRSLFRAGLLTQAVYVCRAFPNRFSGILRPTRPLQRRVRAGFSPGFPLSRPPSDGTWNMFILFSTLSRYNLFVNLYHAFGVLVIFTNRKS